MMAKHMILTELEAPPDDFTELFAKRWIRLPTHGHCPFTGLSRAAYYQLISAGTIRSACLRAPGALRGTRLIWLPSVMAYIERFASGGEEDQSGNE